MLELLFRKNSLGENMHSHECLLVVIVTTLSSVTSSVSLTSFTAGNSGRSAAVLSRGEYVTICCINIDTTKHNTVSLTTSSNLAQG